MDNIEWANVNTFKDKYSLDKAKGEGESESEEKEEEELLSESESVVDSKEGELEFFKKILTCLKPGETVLTAIKRLGAGVSTDSAVSTAGLSASQRWLKKKKTPAAANQKSGVKERKASGEQVKADMQTLEALTGYANHFIDRGYYDIYEETYEKMAFKVNNGVKNEEPEFDMFADEVGQVKAGTSGSSGHLMAGKWWLSRLSADFRHFE